MDGQTIAKVSGLLTRVKLLNALLDELFPTEHYIHGILAEYRRTCMRLEHELNQLLALMNSSGSPKQRADAISNATSILYRARFFNQQGEDVTLTRTSSSDFKWNDSITHYQRFQAELMKQAVSWEHQMVGTPFQDFLLELALKDDNVFNKKALYVPYEKLDRAVVEGRKRFLTRLRLVLDNDLESMMKDYYIKLLEEIERKCASSKQEGEGNGIAHRRYLPPLSGFGTSSTPRGEMESRRAEIKKKLLSDPYWDNVDGAIARYLFGLDVFNLYKIFKVDNWGAIYPVRKYLQHTFNDIVGYKREIGILRRETEALLEGHESNNIFIYGPPGTGKSTSVNALIFTYDELRFIVMTKEQAHFLGSICAQVSESRKRFIIFFDELSYGQWDETHKRLQQEMEGVVDALPLNVRIYAAANTRHPVKGEPSDDTPDERYSALADRFGIKLKFDCPDANTLRDIIVHYARQRKLSIDLTELEQSFIAWCRENDHPRPNGRNVRDFVKTIRD